MFSLNNCRRLALSMAVFACLSGNAWADNTTKPNQSTNPAAIAQSAATVQTASPDQEAEPTEDPRDREIRLLRESVARQQKQIEEMQNTLRLLTNQAAATPNAAPTEQAQAPSEDSESEQQAGTIEPSATEPATDVAQEPANEDSEDEETADLGPTPPEAGETRQQASASASGQQPEMNPNLSLILLGGAKAGGQADDENRNSMYLQEVELAISAPVDPNTRLEAYVGAHQGEGPEVEEAYATYMGLPGGMQVRGGLLANEFGRLNSTHTHALPQIDRPLPLVNFLGEESMRTAGAELSWLAPLPWYCKATLGVGSRQAGHHHEEEEETGHARALTLAEHAEDAEQEDFALFPNGGSKNPLLVARLENMVDLNDDTTLMLGLSHASSSINDETIRDSSLSSADLTLKWTPTGDPNHRSLTWQSEYLSGHQNYVDPLRARQNLHGWYSYLSYQLSQHFRAGLRYDEADVPQTDNDKLKRVSAIVEYIANEFNALRLQYNHCTPTSDKNYDEVLLQWNVVIGPHGAHKY